MGRYDGEEYVRQLPCRSTHEFGMNGTCFKCRWTRDELISWAIDTLSIIAPDVLRDDEPIRFTLTERAQHELHAVTT